MKTSDVARAARAENDLDLAMTTTASQVPCADLIHWSRIVARAATGRYAMAALVRWLFYFENLSTN